MDHGGNNGGGGKWLSSGCSVKALLIGLDGLDVACGGEVKDGCKILAGPNSNDGVVILLRFMQED